MEFPQVSNLERASRKRASAQTSVLSVSLDTVMSQPTPCDTSRPRGSGHRPGQPREERALAKPATVTDATGQVWHKTSTGYYRRASDGKAGKEVSYEFIRDNYGISR